MTHHGSIDKEHHGCRYLRQDTGDTQLDDERQLFMAGHLPAFADIR